MQANFDVTVAKAILLETREMLCLDGACIKTLLGKYKLKDLLQCSKD